MAGYFLDSGQDRDISTSPWKAQFESTTNLGQGFTREAVQTARPDLVFAGWNYGFSETSGLTPDWVRSTRPTRAGTRPCLPLRQR
ncbi:putative iron compound ABC transporter, substrate-binding protein [Mycobacteroides abscessus subsp. abscessus]|nr:putative iron compound ABC transporter, substrate-binding protein [Mycobacteroides abscessus subsp. abscessus]